MSVSNEELLTRYRDECAALRADRDAWNKAYHEANEERDSARHQVAVLREAIEGILKERDALKAQMETVVKGSFDATEVMAEENRLLRADVAKLRVALQESRMFVGSQALGQSRTHRADVLLKRIIDALNHRAPKP